MVICHRYCLLVITLSSAGRQVAQCLSARRYTHSEWLIGKLVPIEKQCINVFQKKSLEAGLVVEYRKETRSRHIKDGIWESHFLVEKANTFSNPLRTLPFKCRLFISRTMLRTLVWDGAEFLTNHFIIIYKVSQSINFSFHLGTRKCPKRHFQGISMEEEVGSTLHIRLEDSDTETWVWRIAPYK